MKTALNTSKQTKLKDSACCHITIFLIFRNKTVALTLVTKNCHQCKFSTFLSHLFLSAFSPQAPGTLFPHIKSCFSVSPTVVTPLGLCFSRCSGLPRNTLIYFHLLKSFLSREIFHFKKTYYVYSAEYLSHSTFLKIVEQINKKKINQ